MGLNLGTGLGGSGLVDLAFATGLGGSGLTRVAGAEAVISALAPVAWYKFNEGTGTDITDYTGNGHDGTAANISWVAGGITLTSNAGVVDFDDIGISGGVARSVVMAHNILSTASADFTFEWYLSAVAGTKWNIVTPSTAFYRFEAVSGGETSTDAVTTGWHFGAWTQSGDNLNTVKQYIDGNSSFSYSTDRSLSTAGNFSLGRNNGIITANCGFGYMLVFDYALSDANIAALRTALINLMAERGVYLPGWEPANVAEAETFIDSLAPVGWYKFDEGTGTTITDYGSVGVDLTGGGAGGSWVTGGFDSAGTRSWAVGGNNLGISGTGARTVIVVANPQNTAGNCWGIEWIGDGGNGKRWTFRNTATAATLRMEIHGEGFTETALTNLANGTWSFGAASMSAGGTALTACDLYHNGETEACTGSTVTINTTGGFQVGTVAGATVVDWIIGYALVFASELTPAQIASVRTALTTIMAARGITLP